MLRPKKLEMGSSRVLSMIYAVAFASAGPSYTMVQRLHYKQVPKPNGLGPQIQRGDHREGDAKREKVAMLENIPSLKDDVDARPRPKRLGR